ncbi:hypothetical protein K3495_g3906 [Podosphaera aphanis]|nr:hypothetical protein K3495_g3906 [Podosphaera aphanis]
MPPEREFESHAALLSYLNPWILEQGLQNKKQKWVETGHGRGAHYKQEIRFHRGTGLEKARSEAKAGS